MELLSAEPRKYPREFATKSRPDKFSAERPEPNAKARSEPIRRDPASEPIHSPVVPRKVKYAPTHPAAYRKKAKPKSK
jgi:hypothetical protein